MPKDASEGPNSTDRGPLSSPLWVAIVNYKTAALTLDCLASLIAEHRRGLKMTAVAVDNASGDGSLEVLRQGLEAYRNPDWIRLEQLPKNGGFAYGNNVVLRQALEAPHPPDYILLLNPDATAREGAIAPLVRFLNEHPKVGLVGSRLEDPDGTPQTSAFRFPSIWSELDNGLRLGIASRLMGHRRLALPIAAEPHPADWLAGASLMIRREVLETAGLFDEDYFLYFEEVDFCHRAQQAGWECWYVPESRVVHLVGQSTGVTDTRRSPQRMPQYWFESRQRYFLKFHGARYTAIADLLWMVGFALWRVRRWLFRKPDSDPPYFLRDFFRNSIWVKRGQS
ncbi:glycosyltransferase family 2 protein [Altericista sp. CCNU0014]|uniref:glycosyltransferase family 2 protein n=1 Tax=Altericista sp. CCNU0014 TaxID=3082949 RepID=UPI00384FFDBA